MADLADKTTQKLLRTIVREETADIRQGFANLRKIIQEETADIRADVKTIKAVQGQHGIVLRAMRTDVTGLKTAYRNQAKEVHKLGVLFEDLDYRFQAASELD
ncbi:MAG TPA: hypothetical protein VIJ68_02930 [Candidatus Saccharimonadales bacterium]